MNYIPITAKWKRYTSTHTKTGATGQENLFQKWSDHKKEQLTKRSEEKKLVEPSNFRILSFQSIMYLRKTKEINLMWPRVPRPTVSVIATSHVLQPLPKKRISKSKPTVGIIFTTPKWMDISNDTSKLLPLSVFRDLSYSFIERAAAILSHYFSVSPRYDFFYTYLTVNMYFLFRKAVFKHWDAQSRQNWKRIHQ